MERTDRLVHVQLDEKTTVRRRPEVEHERAVAIYDLIEDNVFALTSGARGPYTLHLRPVGLDRLIMDVRSEAGDPLEEVPLPLKPFQKIIKDYFMVCESYYDSIRSCTPSQIEALDMGRRGLHNEGSELLSQLIEQKIDIDFDTARRLFTLVCVLHIKG